MELKLHNLLWKALKACLFKSHLYGIEMPKRSRGTLKTKTFKSHLYGIEITEAIAKKDEEIAV